MVLRRLISDLYNIWHLSQQDHDLLADNGILSLKYGAETTSFKSPVRTAL
jgi:hypothetical protein